MHSLAQLTPAPYNPRTIDAKTLEGLKHSLERFGDISGIVVNRRTGHLVAGHQRVKALLEQHGDVPIVDGAVTLPSGERFAVRDVDWDEQTEQAANITANNPHIAGVFTDSLRELLDGLAVELDDFSDLRMDALLATLPPPPLAVVEDELPDPSEVSQRASPGDIWQLGKHRLACGDSTDGELVARLFDGAKPFIMVTDPPYGVSYDPQWRAQLGLMRGDYIAGDDRADWSAAYALFPGAVAYIWCADLHSPAVAAHLDALGFDRRAVIIWRKQQFAISRGHYHWQHELCWYAVRKGQTAKWCGDCSQSTVWDIANLNAFGGAGATEDKTTHGAQKPIECMARPIRNHGGPEDAVYDAFLGSGTTLIAAEQLGRTCYGVELMPAFADLILARWEKHSGQSAVRVHGSA